jgi:hypothetical protein
MLSIERRRSAESSQSLVNCQNSCGISISRSCQNTLPEDIAYEMPFQLRTAVRSVFAHLHRMRKMPERF